MNLLHFVLNLKLLVQHLFLQVSASLGVYKLGGDEEVLAQDLLLAVVSVDLVVVREEAAGRLDGLCLGLVDVGGSRSDRLMPGTA